MKPAAISDYRALAQKRLPRFLFDYIDGGSYDEITLQRNVEDLRAVSLRQRVLKDVSRIDPSTELFGQRMSLPLALAPIGLGGMMARRGEVQAARAAEAAGVPFCLSTVGLCSLAEVAGAVSKPFWFQLYMIRDRGFMRALLEEAKHLGCTALLFTVDLVVAGARHRDRRSGLHGARGFMGDLHRFSQCVPRPAWSLDVGLLGRPHHLGNVEPVLGTNSDIADMFAWLGANFDPSITWKDLDWIRETWPGPLIIKGILDIEDAREAAALGADGLVVSNHGGRQLDGARSTARALPPIAEAVGDRLTILADGGIRSGLDVLRMLALGAQGVLIGRAWAYALGASGQSGVAHMLTLIEAELRVAMALTGVTRIGAIDGAVIQR
jgi:L-lactate dehydrogenase (cytochrome)